MPNMKVPKADKQFFAAVRSAGLGETAKKAGFSGRKEWNQARGAKTAEEAGEERGQPSSVFFEWSLGLLWLVLLWAWIKPIAVMSDWTAPEKMVALFAAVGVCVVMDMLRVPVAVGVPLKGLSAFLAVGWLFRHSGGHAGIGLDWVQEFFSLVAEDARAVTAGDMGAISAENRTLVFLAGWILLAGVIQSVLLYRKRALWLVAATWIYLLLLQLWPGVDTTGELIAAGAAGTGLLGLLQLERIKTVYATGLLSRPLQLSGGLGSPPPEASKLKKTAGKQAHAPSAELSSGRPHAAPESWVQGGSRRSGFQPPLPHALYAGVLGLTLALFVAALAGTGNRERVPQPLTEDLWSMVERVFNPRSELETADAKPVFARQSAGAVTGYGGDDTRLGGPLKVVDKPVFTARTPVSTYWRGESKTVYDGKGWRAEEAGGEEKATWQTGNGTRTAPVNPAAPADYTGADGLLPSDTIAQEIMYDATAGLNLLFAGGTVRSVDALYTLEGKALPPEAAASSGAGNGRYAVASSWGQLGYARLLIDPPVRDAGKLSAAGFSGSGAAIPAEVARTGLQLPAKLPGRVGQLASDITARGDTPYTKALLLEQYLKEHYRYSLTDVPVPRAGQDFVDAFLFSGDSGYCDYFSTAMTVMLRTVGIPARWVKGFAPGQVVGEEAGILTVEVSTKLAHSWVEAYIPGAGWVPFDPTPSFAGFTPGGGAQLTGLLAAGNGNGEPEEKSPFTWASSGLDWLTTLAASIPHKLTTGAQALLDNKLRVLTALAAALALLPPVWLLRRQGLLLLALLLLARRPRGRKGQALVLRLLDRLWLRVFRRYGAKPPGQTFREYAASVGAHMPQAAAPLEELVLLYEHARYAADQPAWLPRRRFARLWQQLFAGPKRKNGGTGVSF